ncbi:MAG: tRNA pseudouridine(38-40) synthase TruA [Oscillospiraceae bacterium]|nr:tRNA pseudouridine(38-40) synthase TruA [Oscillospiraceae bacterium]
MRNFKLTVCYDGGKYRGWQKQGNTPGTIQEKLETLLSRILGQETELAGSGRTDAGVHARRQVCSFRADTALSCGELLSLLRRYLPADIGAVSLEDAPPRFHARLNCVEKTYLYRIWNSDAPNVFERRYMLAYPGALDAAAMRAAAALLCGEHDFSAFCSNRHMKKSAVRELRRIDIEKAGDELRIALTGDGFLYNMARIIVGTLLEVGSGARAPEEMSGILLSRARENAGATAPALGLTLWEVRY